VTETGWTAAERRVWQQLEAGPEQGNSGLPRPAEPPLDGVRIALPPGPPPSPLTRVLSGRRSRRDMTGPLPAADLAAVLGGLFRAGEPAGSTSPTCGDTCSLTPCVLAEDVTGVAPGLYTCRTPGELLAHPSTADWRRRVHERVNRFLRRPATAPPPPALVLWRADWPRIMTRYPGRGLPAVLWDAGAAVQTAYLLAEERGLAGCACAGLPRGAELRELGWEPEAHAFAAAFALGLRSPSG